VESRLPAGSSAFKSVPVDVDKLQFLTHDQVARIDELLASVGDYGEVHLIVQRGQLRYINRVESYKAWNDDGKK
jgi:hypothetical protein